MKSNSNTNPSKDTMKDQGNIFTTEGLLTAIIEDINELSKNVDSVQRRLVYLKQELLQEVRKIVREELARFRGYQ